MKNCIGLGLSFALIVSSIVALVFCTFTQNIVGIIIACFWLSVNSALFFFNLPDKEATKQ